MDTITNIELVKSQLKAQFPKEVVMAPNMTEKVFWLFLFFLQFLCQDYSALMELALWPLLSQYNESSVKTDRLSAAILLRKKPKKIVFVLFLRKTQKHNGSLVQLYC